MRTFLVSLFWICVPFSFFCLVASHSLFSLPSRPSAATSFIFFLSSSPSAHPTSDLSSSASLIAHSGAPVSVALWCGSRSVVLGSDGDGRRRGFKRWRFESSGKALPLSCAFQQGGERERARAGDLERKRDPSPVGCSRRSRRRGDDLEKVDEGEGGRHRSREQGERGRRLWGPDSSSNLPTQVSVLVCRRRDRCAL